jgi:hypothetical protein
MAQCTVLQPYSSYISSVHFNTTQVHFCLLCSELMLYTVDGSVYITSSLTQPDYPTNLKIESLPVGDVSCSKHKKAMRNNALVQ